MIICGIDPGQKGGIAVFQDRTCTRLYPMPDIYRFSDIMYEWLSSAGPSNIHVFMEKAQVMLRDGRIPSATAMFNYGTHFGELQGVLIGLQIPFTLVAPVTWSSKMHAGIPKEKPTKQKSAIAAARLFPGVNFLATDRSRVAHDGLTEAALIGEYGRRVMHAERLVHEENGIYER